MKDPLMNKGEKELLNVLGRNPDISMKELLTHTKYKWTSTVVKKLEYFKEQHILFGPSYMADFGKLCRNPLHYVGCILETTGNLEPVLSILEMIESVTLIFPVLSPHKNIVDVTFLTSDDAAVTDILHLLKHSDIISDYKTRSSYTKCLHENPDLFGEVNPSLDNLLDIVDVPDMFFGFHNTEWNECDITVLGHLLKSRGIKLMDILRKERKQEKTWTYEQVKYSHEKMVKNRLVEKSYAIAPFQPTECACFTLYVKTDYIDLTSRIIYNFARGARIFKEFMLYDEWGMIMCFSHPSFLLGLMNKLDHVEEITEKELYHIRSNPPEKYWVNRPPNLKYFDTEKQTLEYPYSVYKEKVKEALERAESGEPLYMRTLMTSPQDTVHHDAYHTPEREENIHESA